MNMSHKQFFKCYPQWKQADIYSGVNFSCCNMFVILYSNACPVWPLVDEAAVLNITYKAGLEDSSCNMWSFTQVLHMGQG